MIVKFFKSRGGGSAKASIDYLRGKDQARDQALVLKGDPDLSQSIAESLEFKNNYTVGCLSFEEPDLPIEQKREIMEKFEKTFFAGLEEDQYNITWIEHRDKGRLELNYFIPNVELQSKKRLQPYYDRADRHLADNFKKVINHEYGLTNPDDPSKSQLLKHDLRTPKPIKEIKEGITHLVSQHIEKGTIKSQEQLSELLDKSGLEVSRVTKNSISIKNPSGGRNIRLDGEIYKKEFYEQTATIEEFRKHFASGTGEPKRGDREDHERDYRHAQEQLRIAVERRTERNNELYAQSHSLDFDFDYPDRSYSLSRGGSDDLHEDIEQSDQRITTNKSVIRTIRIDYSTKRDRDHNERRGRDLLDKQRQKDRDLHLDRRKQGHENSKLKGIINELSRRTQEFIGRTEKTLREARERAQKLFEYVRGIGERKSEIEGISETIRGYSQELFDSDKEFRVRNSETEKLDQSVGFGIKQGLNRETQRMGSLSEQVEQREQQTAKIDRHINGKTREIDRGFSMGR